jgi:hypothetical protein
MARTAVRALGRQRVSVCAHMRTSLQTNDRLLSNATLDRTPSTVGQ